MISVMGYAIQGQGHCKTCPRSLLAGALSALIYALHCRIDRAFSGYLVRSGNRDSDAGRSGVGASRAAVVVVLDAAAEEIRA